MLVTTRTIYLKKTARGNFLGSVNSSTARFRVNADRLEAFEDKAASEGYKVIHTL